MTSDVPKVGQKVTVGKIELTGPKSAPLGFFIFFFIQYTIGKQKCTDSRMKKIK